MNSLSELNPISRWLDVSGSIGQNINTLPSNVVFSDTSSDMDYKLLIGDLGSPITKPKVKVFSTSITHELILPDIPTAVVSFFTNESIPRNCPVVAVAMCSSVHIYKNLKLFFKFYLPSMEVQSLEVEVWRQLSDGFLDEESVAREVEKLNSLPFSSLTSHSQFLLSLPVEKYLSFVKQLGHQPQLKSSVITCMTTINFNSKETDGAASLVMGTENGDVLILDSQTFAVMHQARVSAVKGTPSHIEASGLYDVEYRIIIATREGTICVLRRGWLEGKILVQKIPLVVGLIIMPGDSSIVVGCMDKTLQCYSKKGKKNWSVTLENTISTITLVPLAHLGANLIGVAMAGGLVEFYSGKNLVDSIHMQDTISVMKFGQIGQEEHVLALVTIDGTIVLKILKRTADFNLTGLGISQKSHVSMMSTQQVKPLLVPKKSKLFLEQAAREREQSIQMHETFQKELCNLRLHVARATVEAMRKSSCSLSTGATETLKLSAQVQGLGPIFKIYLVLENLSPDTAVSNLSLLLVADHRSYSISSPYIPVPMLVSGQPYTFITKVRELFLPRGDGNPEEQMLNEDSDLDTRPYVKVVLHKEGQVQPLLAASIYVPPTDPLMMPFNN